MTPAEFVGRALTVPFVDCGRSWDGWDCWGLVTVHHREVLGIELPAFDAGYETAGDTATDREVIAAMVKKGRASWCEIETPEPSDVLLMRCWGRPIHVGVMVDGERFVHAEKSIGTVVERLSSPMWAKRIEGAYRYEPTQLPAWGAGRRCCRSVGSQGACEWRSCRAPAGNALDRGARARGHSSAAPVA